MLFLILYFAIALSLVAADGEVTIAGARNVREGQPIQLICITPLGNDLQWYREETQLESDTDAGVSVVSRISRKTYLFLMIDPARPENGGEYTCLSSDGNSASVTINIKEQRSR